MGTWYDVTSKGRPQASWQLPSSEGGGYGYGLSGREWRTIYLRKTQGKTA